MLSQPHFCSGESPVGAEFVGCSWVCAGAVWAVLSWEPLTLGSLTSFSPSSVTV